MSIKDIVEVFAWALKLIPALIDLKDSLKTEEPGQHYAANQELLRQMRLQIRAEKEQEARIAIASDALLEALSRAPMADDKPYGEK